MIDKAQNDTTATDSSSEEDAPSTERKPEPSGAPKIPDEVVEAEIEAEEAKLDEALAGRFADDFGASHQGGMGTQGGQTDFGNPRKFAGPGT